MHYKCFVRFIVTVFVTDGAVMAGKVRHMVNRDGRYFARLVVPKDLRGFVDKTELRTALGADYRQALRLYPVQWRSFKTRSLYVNAS